MFFLNFSLFYVSLQYQGVSGIIIVTMVTSFMLVYNNSSGGSSSPSAASLLSSHRSDGPSTKKPERPQRVPASTLEGYTGVMDHKVNMHHLYTGIWCQEIKKQKNLFTFQINKRYRLLQGSNIHPPPQRGRLNLSSVVCSNKNNSSVWGEGAGFCQCIRCQCGEVGERDLEE